MPTILALDTATPACTAALLNDDGSVIAEADQVMARGHAERLMPILHDLLRGRRPDRILVGCGPGSFTGLRVGIAGAHGMAIGWGVPLAGFSTLALIAAAQSAGEPVGVALLGGHGELFVQQFGADLLPEQEVSSLAPNQAAHSISATLVVGSGAATLVEARGWGEARDGLPSAAHILRVPEALRSLAAKPSYAREPDAKAKAA